MSFFNKILTKLGIGGKEAAAQTVDAAQVSAPEAAAPAAPATATPATAAAATPVQEVPMVDVVADLEKKAAANPQKLNWRTSIVDLLKLLDLDSSLTARKELANELGCPGDLMGDSAKMNMWLHKTVLAKIAANGGNIPQDLIS